MEFCKGLWVTKQTSGSEFSRESTQYLSYGLPGGLQDRDNEGSIQRSRGFLEMGMDL